MSSGIVKTRVTNMYDPHELVYEGPLLYTMNMKLRGATADQLSNILEISQSQIHFVALDNKYGTHRGDLLGRHSTGWSQEPILHFENLEIIDENHPDYQKCMDVVNDMVKESIVKPGTLVQEPENRIPEVLDWDYIDENTRWVAHFDDGRRIVGSHKDVEPYYKDRNIDEIDVVTWEGQPKDLQGFYKAHTYAFYDLNRHDLYNVKDFYDEWSKNPAVFVPELKPVIGKLSDVLPKLDVTDDLIVSNYYGYGGAGNHRVGNFIEALNDLNMDFEIVKFEPKNPNEEYSANHVWVQTDNMKALNAFSAEANSNAIKHDRFFGDGRYEDAEINKRLNIVKQALNDFNTDKSPDKTYSEKRKAMEAKLERLLKDKDLMAEYGDDSLFADHQDTEAELE